MAFPRALRSVVGVVLVGAALGTPSPVAAQPLAYVLGDRTGTNDLVTVVDTATLAKVTSIPVGSGSPSLYGGGIAVAPDGGRVYVVNNTDRTISVISTLTNTVLGTFASGRTPPASSSARMGRASTWGTGRAPAIRPSFG